MRQLSTLLSLLAVPVLATQYSGTIVDLSGSPVAGVIVSGLSDSATTGSDGSWILGSTTSLAASSPWSSRTGHLSVQNGRIRLDWNGAGADGRSQEDVATPTPRPQARILSQVDTLKVTWNGRRLIEQAFPGQDSAGIGFRIDTGWSDDQGIRWNPAIEYGSLSDARDGQTYRTVTIGSQTWMAQNLDYAGSSGDTGRCYKGSTDSCAKYGRLYTWAEAVKGAKDSLASLPAGVQGLCPNGWHVPSDSQWQILEQSVGMPDTIASRGDYRGSTEGFKLRSRTGWGTDTTGTDLFGFRVLPAGEYDGGYSYIGTDGEFWTATVSPGYYPLKAYDRGFQQRGTIWRSDAWKASKSFSLRCLQD